MTHHALITRLGFAALACAPLSTALGEGSELPDGSVTITSLPFFDTGDTSDNLDDYDAVCPWASDSPDVFYTFVPPEGVYGIDIYLCCSDYDTKTYVLNDQFETIACNDDNCTSGACGTYRSHLECAYVAPGQTYHIAIDGWSGASGPYDLEIESCTPGATCDFDDLKHAPCPPDAIDENEPCTLESPDVTNGGCFTESGPLFQAVECGDTVCGRVAIGFAIGFGYYDSDWFELHTDVPGVVSMSVVAESTVSLSRVVPLGCPLEAPDCSCVSKNQHDPYARTDPCLKSTITAAVPAGRSWWRVSPVSGSIIPCDEAVVGNEYVVTWSCVEMTCCAHGDADDNGTVDFDDLVVMLGHWGDCAAQPCCALGDANADGTVGYDDVVILLANWGPCDG